MVTFRGGIVGSMLVIFLLLSMALLAEKEESAAITVENTNNTADTTAATSANVSESNTTDAPAPETTTPPPDNETAAETNNTLTEETVSAPASAVTLSVVANPASGTVPLTVQFTAIATGKAPITYSWDFNHDGIPDSTQQNPAKTLSAAGEYNVTVTATDANEESAIESIPITVTAFDSHLSLSSYFPTEFNKGAAQITFIISNDGTEIVNNIAARIIGEGVEYLTSSTLPTLNPGDKDTVTVKVNILKSGTLQATAKVLDKNFPITLDVTQQVEYNKVELEAELASVKQQLDQQEKAYYEKKSDGYLVSEMADQIKDLKQQVLETEQQLFTGKLADASVGLHISKSAITDLSSDIQNATKPKVTPLQWLKENAVAIAAIIAAFGTISGLLIKAKHKAAKAAEQAGKLGKEWGKELSKKKWFGKKGEVGSQPASAPTVEEETEGNPLTDEEKEEK